MGNPWGPHLVSFEFPLQPQRAFVRIHFATLVGSLGRSYGNLLALIRESHGLPIGRPLEPSLEPIRESHVKLASFPLQTPLGARWASRWLSIGVLMELQMWLPRGSH